MYYRFGKVFHFLSIMFFILVFIYIYSSVPETVAYEIDDQGIMVKGFSRNSFFYVGIVIFAVLNISLALPAKMIEKQSTANLKRLFPIGDKFRDYMLTWIFSFIGIVNVSLCILTLFVHSINNQNEISSSSFSGFFYMVPILFVTWIVALFWILSQKFKTLQHGT
ncbi:MAG: DNA topoisomerase IV [Mongoliibacter sp.]|uniref:DNA topoisomerase IV n=1 Tax=Mongoliibacter sp. TaxID=2022438 RepID=UPI0012F2C63D|nr:DNA topoisomerase IV [Mongoliibacter sp.]TVP44136.1 MAG: DNA topoisomerase IV [Mongoliibacter sp.]